MVQFNLLPDVKLEYIKARRVKRLVTLVSVVVSAGALVVFLLMVTTVYVVQKKSLHDLNSDIGKFSTQLKNVNDLSKILTVQNQLNALNGTPSKPGLHDQKVVASRLFTYISKIVPADATITNLTVDFAANTMSISGEAPGLSVVNNFTDTLKATTYATSAVKGNWTSGTDYKSGDVVQDNGRFYAASADNTAESNTEPGTGSNWQQNWSTLPSAFSSVVLSSFGRDSKSATYTITLSFDPIIFNSTNDVNLTVPVGTALNTSKLFVEQAK